MNPEQHFTLEYLLGRTHYVLLNEVIPSLRGVSVELKEKEVILNFYHNGPLTYRVEDHYSCLATEIISAFPGGTLEENMISLAYPAPLPREGCWAYRRKEPFLDP